MPMIKIVLDGDGALADRDPAKLLELEGPITVSGLPGGMQSGKPSVAFWFDLPDGRTVFAQTSMALFLAAARAFRGRYGDVDEQ